MGRGCLRLAPNLARLRLVRIIAGRGRNMDTFNIHEAKTHFSKLVDSVMQGNEIVIAKAGKAAVKLVPISSLKPKLRLRARCSLALRRFMLAVPRFGKRPSRRNSANSTQTSTRWFPR